MKQIGYKDYADICDSAVESGMCCSNCYGTGPRAPGSKRCIDCEDEENEGLDPMLHEATSPEDKP